MLEQYKTTSSVNAYIQRYVETYLNLYEINYIKILIYCSVLLLHISTKLTLFGNNVNNIFLKGVFYLIRKVEIAGVNKARLPVLSNEEKQELLVKIKNGDENAMEKFI